MKLQDLLSRYETALARGESLTPEEFCRDHPQLLDQFRLHARAIRGIAAPDASGPEMVATTAAEEAASRYTVLKAHARGGLGEVYLARDDALGRDVALKVMTGPTEDARRRRFEREAAITGRLQHPGIVPVYGTGVDDRGRPCHVMRFVAGPTLAEAIAEFHSAKQTLDRSNPNFRQLLSRIVQVAQTIAFAHSRGVIHRDLKPSNIILGDYGETLVIDWGLAKELSNGPAVTPGVPTPMNAAETPFGGSIEATREYSDSSSGYSDSETQAGAMLGTPAFVSPEQARGEEVTPATDLFALGGLLYNLLTGAAPYGGFDVADLFERSRAGRVPPVAERASDAPRALAVVCEKAMAPAPADRFASALTFAAELERWLADEPLVSVADPLSVRLRRWTRRHRLLVASSVAALLVAAVSLGVATGLLSRKNEDLGKAIQLAELNEREATAASHLATTREVEASENFQTALDALDKFTLQLNEDPRLRAHDMEQLRRDMLTDAAAFYKRLAGRRGDDPALRKQIIRAHYLLGMISQEIGDAPAAEREYRAAQSLLDADQSNTSREHRMLVCDNATGLCSVLRMKDDYKAALTAMRQAHAAAVAALGPDPATAGDRFLLAGVEEQLAITLSFVEGDCAEANALFEHVFAMARINHAERGGSPHHWITLPRALKHHGTMKMRAGKAGAAEKSWKEAREFQKNLPTQAIDRGLYLKHNLVEVCNQLGALYRGQQRLPDAEEAFAEAVQHATMLVQRHPMNVFYMSDKATALFGLGTLKTLAKKNDDAETLLREAAKLREIVYRKTKQLNYERHALMNVYTALARALLEQSKFDDAAKELGNAENLHKHGPADVEVGIAIVIAWSRLGMAAKENPIADTAFDAALDVIRLYAQPATKRQALLMLSQLGKAGGLKSDARAARLDDPAFAVLQADSAFREIRAKR